jgi:hypothetical protein
MPTAASGVVSRLISAATTAARIVSGTIETLHALSDNFYNLSVRAIASRELAGGETAINGDKAALGEIGRNVISGLLPTLNSKKVGIRRTITWLYALIYGDTEIANTLAGRRGPEFRIAGETAYENNAVNHVSSS